MRPLADLFQIPPARSQALERLGSHFQPGLRVALSTHINADGDGCGSEAALARLLAQWGMTARIVNPTPWPAMFDFLLGDDIDERSTRGAGALREVDLLIVVDISDVNRLGTLADTVRSLHVPKLVIDHHVPGREPPAAGWSRAQSRAAPTGERSTWPGLSTSTSPSP